MGKKFCNAKVLSIGQRDADKAKVLSIGKLKFPYESAFARENYNSHVNVRSLGERNLSSELHVQGLSQRDRRAPFSHLEPIV